MTEAELQEAIDLLRCRMSFNVAFSGLIEIPVLLLPDTPEARSLVAKFAKRREE